MAWNLRRATPADTDYILTFFREAIQVLCKSGIQQWDEIYPGKDDIKNDIDLQEMFILEDKGTGDIAGAAVINQDMPGYENGDWKYPAKSAAVIHRLCVNPKFQGNGIGTMLTDMMGTEMQRMGYKSARLDAFSKNTISCPMYEKLGYRKVGEVSYRKGIFYLYEKKL